MRKITTAFANMNVNRDLQFWAVFLSDLFFPSYEQYEFEFFSFKHHIGGSQQLKNMFKILKSLGVLLLAAKETFFVQSIPSF